MQVNTMRRADRWLGIPACFVLTVVRRLTDRVRRSTATAPRRIAFIKLAEQGSTVLAYRALRMAVNKVGRENVFFVAFAENRFILDAMGVIPVENVLAIPTSSFGAVVRGAVRVICQLRRARISATLDCEFFSRASAALSYLSGANLRVGFHAFGDEASWRGDLMSHRLSYNPHIHTSETFALLVAALDWTPEWLPAIDVEVRDSDASVPQWHASPEELRRMRRLVVGDTPQAGQAIVLLNANCSDLVPLRRWPGDRYVELARRLLAESPDVWVAFTGAEAEARAAAELVDAIQHERCVTVAGRTTLADLLSLYAASDVLVTNDSGPAHFALLTPIDVVTLFGPETPSLYGARSSQNHVIWAALPCSPCVSAYNDRLSGCRNNLCMQKISVDRVFTQVCTILDRRRRAGAGPSW